ncbi:L-type lectin-domain containing receptor kinase IX.1-like [Silene latifolia]|uniref:L-type lectin-domain containing receptor kinase IX.1-like n=1 Tax=Silene latifolia TaxID=37657 RepID=UPI003D76BC6F
MPRSGPYFGDGLTFYLAPVNSSVPVNSTGGSLGLVNPLYFNDTSKNQFVAVEFDSFKNFFDPSDDHFRLVDHGLGSQTTVLAGTIGYMAPECVITGKASKETDVYSFGVVALEIACGRRPVKSREEPSKVRMVEWVWSLYGQGRLLEAVDKRLNEEFDLQQTECLMVVGLWCCHPDYSQRPSIRQVINVLNMDSPLPILPSKQPVPTYFAPPMNMDLYSNTSSSAFSGSTATTSSSSSQSVLTGTAPLLSQKASI